MMITGDRVLVVKTVTGSDGQSLAIGIVQRDILVQRKHKQVQKRGKCLARVSMHQAQERGLLLLLLLLPLQRTL